MNETDMQLLERYARHRAEDAFAEIVRRYLDLVFSSALRQVRLPQLAQEVVQSVFSDLALQSDRLLPNTILAAWLYHITRRTAIDLVRREARRQLREQVACELTSMNATSDDWTHIEPLLDDAMQALQEIDRTAVLLRFFENKSLREVGQMLGTTEDAARKRVSRAVERLREYFLEHGATASLGGIGVVISANAVQAAPASLLEMVSTFLLMETASKTGSVTLLKSMAMTKLKVAAISTLFAASLVTSLIILRNVRARIPIVRRETQQKASDIARLESENQRLSNIIAAVRDPSSNNEAGLRNLRDRISSMQQQTNDFAALRAEEQRLQSLLAKAREALTGDPNSQATTNTPNLHAKIFYIMDLATAARNYAEAHKGQLPADFEQAAQFISAETRNQTNFTPSQFEIVYRGTLQNIDDFAHPDRIMLVRERQPWQNKDGKWVTTWSDLRAIGHYYSPVNGDFEVWQAQHTIPPTSPTQ